MFCPDRLRIPTAPRILCQAASLKAVLMRAASLKVVRKISLLMKDALIAALPYVFSIYLAMVNHALLIYTARSLQLNLE